MIYTVTFNPSLDYVVRVEDFMIGSLHRTKEEALFAGGKGINVSIVLKELGLESTVLGFVAGFTGQEIIKQINTLGISSDFISLSQGISRINVKLKSGKDAETEINAKGPAIEEGELAQLIHKLDILNSEDILVLSGNVNQSLAGAAQLYAKLCRKAVEAGAVCVVDAEGTLLWNALHEKPLLVKPNREELGVIVGKTLSDREDILAAAKLLKQEGARNILVSLGAEGAMLLDEDGEAHWQTAPQGKALNTVGAGDSMLAGFLVGLSMMGTKKSNRQGTYTYEQYDRALRYAVAAGSAAAFSVGLPKKGSIEELYRTYYYQKE